jgi:hypothetical protein
LPLAPVVGDASVLSLDLRSKTDRRSLFERRSPINSRSSSDRVSAPLRRSWPDRRPALERLSSSAMPFLHQTNTVYVVAERAVNNPISSAGGMFWRKKAEVDIACNRLGSLLAIAAGAPGAPKFYCEDP